MQTVEQGVSDGRWVVHWDMPTIVESDWRVGQSVIACPSLDPAGYPHVYLGWRRATVVHADHAYMVDVWRTLRVRRRVHRFQQCYTIEYEGIRRRRHGVYCWQLKEAHSMCLRRRAVR